MSNRFIEEFGPEPSDIVICGSMSHKDKWLEVAEELRNLGYIVATPDISEKDGWSEMTQNQIADQKGYLIRQHLAKISASKAILVYNDMKNGVEDYIGGSTFMEMSAAFVLDKPIFLYSPIPDMTYRDEMVALGPIVLGGDLSKITID